MNSPVQPKVSICVSVHNTADLLPRCLDSLTQQTINSLELILVNNGSTDETLEVMKNYQKRYPDVIRIYSQDDRGLAQGRQTGINKASGEFVGFLDADDCVVDDAFERMYQEAVKNNVEIIECATVKDGEVIRSQYEGLQQSSRVLKDYFKEGNVPSMMWMRLYKRSLFSTPIFPDLYVNNEDIFGLPILLHKAKSIFFLNEPLHFYMTDNENSVMYGIKKGTIDEERLIQNRLKVLLVRDHLESTITKTVIDRDYAVEFKAHLARLVVDFCLNDYNSTPSRELIRLAVDRLGMSKSELNRILKTLRYSNRVIQFLLNNFGLLFTMKAYRMLSWLRSIFGQSRRNLASLFWG